MRTQPSRRTCCGATPDAPVRQCLRCRTPWVRWPRRSAVARSHRRAGGAALPGYVLQAAWSRVRSRAQGRGRIAGHADIHLLDGRARCADKRAARPRRKPKVGLGADELHLAAGAVETCPLGRGPAVAHGCVVPAQAQHSRTALSVQLRWLPHHIQQRQHHTERTSVSALFFVFFSSSSFFWAGCKHSVNAAAVAPNYCAQKGCWRADELRLHTRGWLRML